MKVQYTKRAEADLVAIARYTVEQWGDAQWEAYGALLEETCERIIPANLRHAQLVPEREGVYRWRCERHVVFFRRVRGGIEIVRVLHERMLPSRHL